MAKEGRKGGQKGGRMETNINEGQDDKDNRVTQGREGMRHGESLG